MLVYLQMIEEPRHKSKFEEIYNAYRNLMYYIAYKYLHNEHDAEDAVHHAFVKIAENIKNIDPVSPKTCRLVVTIVENRVIDVLRARSRHPEVGLEEQHYIAYEEPQSDSLLIRCIGQLTDIQRQVITLKYYEGYDLHEISKMLGISLSWAQKIDQRAKAKLKKLYEEGAKNRVD